VYSEDFQKDGCLSVVSLSYRMEGVWLLYDTIWFQVALLLQWLL